MEELEPIGKGVKRKDFDVREVNAIHSPLRHIFANCDPSSLMPQLTGPSVRQVSRFLH